MGMEGGKIRSFGPFQLDIGKRLLRHDGKDVQIPPKEIEILCRLAERPGELVTKEELIGAVWPDSYVEESNLSRHIYILRKKFVELGYPESLIENVPKRGYRFIGKVENASDTEAAEPEVQDGSLLNSESAGAADSTLSTGSEKEPTDAERYDEQIARDAAGPLPDDGLGPSRSRNNRHVLISLGILLLATVSALAVYFLFLETPSGPTSVKSIAVLRFTTAADDSDAAYIGHGMTETLIQKLSKNRQIVVKRLTVPGTPQQTVTDPTEIGRKLGVDAILDGGIQRTADKVRVTARLVRISDGQTIWNETYEELSGDLFELQDSISEQVFKALSIELSGTEITALKTRRTENADAEHLYQRARYFWNKRSKEGFVRSIELFEQALGRDASFPHPYAGIADAYLLLGDYGFLSPRESMEPAKRYASAALNLDNTLAEAHTSLAYVRFLYDWDWAGSESSFRRAIELDPSYPTARLWYAEYLIAAGRSLEAKDSIRAAQSLDPQSPSIVAVSCWVSYIERHYQQALGTCDEALEMDSGLSTAYFWKGQTLEKLDRPAAAVDAYRKALALSPDSVEVAASLGHALGRIGDKAGAEEVRAKLSNMARSTYVSPYFIALLHLGLDDRTSALKELERAVDERSRAVPFFNVDPMLDSLHQDPEFDRIKSIARVPNLRNAAINN